MLLMPAPAANPNVRVSIVLDDPDFLVVDKPAGVVTQPGKGHTSDSLLNGLFHHRGALLRNLGEARDWGLLHRLDRETSGLLLVGLRPRAYDALRAAFENREVEKRYWAGVVGRPAKEAGVIRRAIREATGVASGAKRAKRSGGEHKPMRLAEIVSASAPGAKPAVTAYRVLDSNARASLLECRLGTGRLHQIRVHLESIGCPVLGDGLYGGRLPPPRATTQARTPARPRLALHACALAFRHPVTGAPVEVWSPCPADLATLLRRFRLRLPHPAASGGVSDTGAGPNPSAGA